MSDSKDKILKRIEKYNAQSKYELSIELLKRLLNYEPDDIQLINLMAASCDLAGKKYLAVGYFHKSADCYIQKYHYDKALAVYKKIIKIQPDDPKAYEKTAKIYELNSNFTEAADQLTIAAQKYRSDGNTEQSIELYKNAIRLNPFNQRLKLQLVELYKQTGDTEKAIELYLEFADNFITKGDLAGARTILENILKLDSKNIKALQKLASVASKIGNKEQALSAYQKILSLDPENAETLSSFAIEYYERFHDIENAANMLKKAHRLRPDNLEILLKLKEITPEDLEVRQALKVYYLDQDDKKSAVMEILGISDIFERSKNISMATKLRQKAEEMLRSIEIESQSSPTPSMPRERIISLGTLAEKKQQDKKQIPGIGTKELKMPLPDKTSSIQPKDAMPINVPPTAPLPGTSAEFTPSGSYAVSTPKREYSKGQDKTASDSPPPPFLEQKRPTPPAAVSVPPSGEKNIPPPFLAAAKEAAVEKKPELHKSNSPGTPVKTSIPDRQTVVPSYQTTEVNPVLVSPQSPAEIPASVYIQETAASIKQPVIESTVRKPEPQAEIEAPPKEQYKTVTKRKAGTPKQQTVSAEKAQLFSEEVSSESESLIIEDIKIDPNSLTIQIDVKTIDSIKEKQPVAVNDRQEAKAGGEVKSDKERVRAEEKLKKEEAHEDVEGLLKKLPEEMRTGEERVPGKFQELKPEITLEDLKTPVQMEEKRPEIKKFIPRSIERLDVKVSQVAIKDTRPTTDTVKTPMTAEPEIYLKVANIEELDKASFTKEKPASAAPPFQAPFKTEVRKRDLEILQNREPQLQEDTAFNLQEVFQNMKISDDLKLSSETIKTLFTDDTANLSLQMNKLLNSMITDEVSQPSEDDETRLNLGISYMEMGLYEDAIAEFRSIADKTNFKVKAARFLALAYSHKKDNLEAIKWYSKAADLSPDGSEEKNDALFFIGDLYLSLGDFDNAQKYLMEVYRKNPNYHGVVEKLEYIHSKSNSQ